MNIGGIPREIRAGETRVAATPEILIEKSAGNDSRR
jgi:NAD/NADP transhydrogenase alpha subunit